MSTSGPPPVELGDVAPSFTPSFGRESDESFAGKETAETNISAQNRHQSADGSRSAGYQPNINIRGEPSAGNGTAVGYHPDTSVSVESPNTIGISDVNEQSDLSQPKRNGPNKC